MEALAEKVINSMDCVLVGYEEDGTEIWWHVGYNLVTDETNFNYILLYEG